MCLPRFWPRLHLCRLEFSGKHAAGQGPPLATFAVPVVTAAAAKGDINVYITGLGTVTALYTATILTRVTGQVMEVPFKEGDIVKKGALLVEVDPRPFEAAVLQAEGQLARDKALLEEAKRDFKRYDILVKQDSIAQQTRDDQVYLVHQYEGTVKLDEGNLDSRQSKSGLTLASLLRSPGESGCGSWTREISFTQPTPPGLPL